LSLFLLFSEFSEFYGTIVLNPTALLNAEPFFEPISFNVGGKNLGYSRLLSYYSCFKNDFSNPFICGFLTVPLFLVTVFGYSSNLTFFTDLSDGSSSSSELSS